MKSFAFFIRGDWSKEFEVVKWWKHLNSQRCIEGRTKAIQLKEKCKDYESSISSKQNADLDQEI